MPIIFITLINGRTDKQKEQMYTEVTNAVCRTLNTSPDHVRIILNEVPPEHFATAGIKKSGPSSG